MFKLFALLALAALPGISAEKMAAHKLIDLAGRAPNTPGLQQALHQAITDTFPEADLKKGVAALGQGPDFIWAIDSATKPSLFVDGAAEPAMKQIRGSNLWFATGKLKTGMAHNFYYLVDGNRFGGSYDLPAYGPESYAKPGVPQGTLSEKMVHTSKIYDGMKSDYWVYVPAQYDAKTPAALMVWQDGATYNQRDGGRTRILDVIDNLISEKKIPVMIQVFISPGKIGDKAMRSIEYDTVNDTYARFLRDELLVEVQKKYSLRNDAYSRGITGLSSGGICAFNAAWQQPDQFSRVLSWIGSFTSIQWQPGVIDGGNVYPNKIRKEAKRNIRAWLQDGSEDLENRFGSWPLQNIQMANSLKLKDYDFHLAFGHGTHNPAHGSAQFPEEMAWLWRDYDPSKREQTYEMDPSEKSKPLFRVNVYNRDHE
ncbi:MAG: alpha/beta hydrolase-fold protein [Acidobacteriota bacterium]|nr:alpha/beta hydrolase-fold protein [Acidobacteriota bacterium]